MCARDYAFRRDLVSYCLSCSDTPRGSNSYNSPDCSSHGHRSRRVKMFNKPFRPPTILKPLDKAQIDSSDLIDEPPLKKRRLSPEIVQRPENDPPPLKPIHQRNALTQDQRSQPALGTHRKPLVQVLGQPTGSDPSEEKSRFGNAVYYKVVWCACQWSL